MKCILLNTGKTEVGCLSQMLLEYTKRINKFISFQVKDIQTNKISGNLPVEKIKEKEATLLTKQLSGANYIVLLDERGETLTSKEFARKINKLMLDGVQNLVFVTGGAYGFSNEIYDLANEKISLSKMTFTHQLSRIVFSEQFYRAMTIIKGIPYHHD